MKRIFFCEICKKYTMHEIHCGKRTKAKFYFFNPKYKYKEIRRRLRGLKR